MKKVCMILLILMLSAQAFAFTIAMAETDETSSNAELLFVKQVGIFPDSLNEGEVLTRRSLAKIYFDIIMPHLTEVEYMEIKKEFTDIEETDFFISILAKSGIMSGLDNGRFEPNRAVTYPELLKSMIVFLGYKDEAENKGGYPAGYFVVGSKFGFSRLAPANANDIVTSEVAAAMFKIALRIDLNSVQTISADGSAHIYKALKNISYLEYYKDIIVGEGIVTANYLVDLYNNSNLKYFSIKLDDMFMNLSDAALDLKDKLGYRVMVVYQSKDGGSPEVLYWEPVDTNVFMVDANDVIGLESDRTNFSYYNEAGRTSRISIDTAHIVYNGSLCISYDESVLNPFTDAYLDGSVIFIDNNNDNSADVVIIDAFDSFVVDRVVDGKIFNKYVPSSIIDLKDVDNGDIAVENIVGDTIPISSISAGDIMNVSKDLSGEVKKVVVTVDTYIGILEEFERYDNKLKRIIVNGMEFECANSINRNPQLKLLKSGQQIKLHFNKDKRVSDVELEEFEEYRIGFLIAAGKTEDISDTVQIKVFTAHGQMEIFNLRKIINISKTGDTKTADAILKNLKQPDGLVERQPIKYKINSKGEISDLLMVDKSINEFQDGFYMYTDFNGSAVAPSSWTSSSAWPPYYLSRVSSFGGRLLLSGSTIVFVVPEESDRSDDEKYTATSPTFFKHGSGNLPFKAYGTKVNNPTAEIIVVQSVVGKTLDNTFMIVTNTRKVIDNNGEEMYKIEGFISGQIRSYTGKEEVVLVGPSCTLPDVGDVVRIAIDAYGEFGAMDFVFDASKKEFGAGYPEDNSFYHQRRIQYGTVAYLDDIVFTVKSINAADMIIRESYPLSSFSYYKYSDNGRRCKLTLSDRDILTSDLYGAGLGSKVLIYTPEGYGNFIIVFEEE
jgi:hypothetical protein